jgi:hypothetical protein
MGVQAGRAPVARRVGPLWRRTVGQAPDLAIMLGG